MTSPGGPSKLTDPGSLRRAVINVIEQNRSIGIMPARFMQATEEGDAPRLEEVCADLITQEGAAPKVADYVRRFPTTLTLEDYVACWGASWGLSADVVEVARQRVRWLDEIAGFQRYSCTQIAETPATHVPTSPSRKVKLAPSILAADFARLGEVVRETEAAGADYIHIDVMDGRFVPNLTVGPSVVESIRPHTSLTLDSHLMVVEPERLVPDFVKAGSDIITIHQEAVTHLHRAVYQIKELGVLAGVSINPSTPASVLEEVLPDVDLVLVMSVNPGFGGQSFIPNILSKIERVRGMLDSAGLRAELEVDGGIKADNVDRIVSAGAAVIVAGSAVYNNRDTVADALARLRERIDSVGTRA